MLRDHCGGGTAIAGARATRLYLSGLVGRAVGRDHGGRRAIRVHLATGSGAKITLRSFSVRAAVLPFALLFAAAALSACGDFVQPAPPPGPEQRPAGLFGPAGITLFGNAPGGNAAGGGEIGVNTFLWRASLDTISFMPLASADPFGGIIITDWYTPPEAAGGERFKLTVYILDKRLRSDGVRVAVFRQQRDGQPGAEWRDAAAATASATDIENAILLRARQMWLEANAQP